MTMDIHEILKQLPHRYPFLLVDRVLELEKGKRIKALKNVTINEPFFLGHFPHRPVMPGVLMLEALAQAAALLSFDSRRASSPTTSTVFYFAGIDGARFKRPVEPGDQLMLDVDARPHRRRASSSSRRARTVGDELAVEAELMCTMRTVELSGGARWRTSTRPRSSSPAPSWPTTVSVGPYSVDRRRTCAIGAGTTIGPHCVIEGRTTIGRDNRIFQFCSHRRGAAGQEVRRRAHRSCEIGDRNTIREFCTFNLGTAQDAGVTRIGNDNWIMAYVHIAHDCQVGNHTIFANNAHARRPRAPRRLGRSSAASPACTSSCKIGAHAMAGFAERGLAGRAAVHDGRRQPARGARLQRRGPAPARLHAPSASPRSSRCTGCSTATA